MGAEEYKSRTYCISIGCPVISKLDQPWPSEDDKRIFKMNACRDCEAKRFHDWLKENNYYIIKMTKDIS